MEVQQFGQKKVTIKNIWLDNRKATQRQGEHLPLDVV